MSAQGYVVIFVVVLVVIILFRKFLFWILLLSAIAFGVFFFSDQIRGAIGTYISHTFETR